MKDRAFTLIELLIVIAVIGILVAILLPTLAHSKAAAKRIHCVGNVKQSALATHLYAWTSMRIGCLTVMLFLTSILVSNSAFRRIGIFGRGCFGTVI